MTKLRTEFLPFKTCTWIGPNSIVVAVSALFLIQSKLLSRQFHLLNVPILSMLLQGHNCCPLLYTLDSSGQLSYLCKLDNSQKKEAGGIRLDVSNFNWHSAFYL